MAVLETGAAPISRTRNIAFQVSTVLFALFYAFLLTALSALLGRDWSQSIHRVHHTAAVLGNIGIMDPAFLIFLVPVVVLVALHPARRRLFRLPASLSEY